MSYPTNPFVVVTSTGFLYKVVGDTPTPAESVPGWEAQQHPRESGAAAHRTSQQAYAAARAIWGQLA